MLVTYNWLKEFVKIDISADDLAKKLTSIGPEVASIKKVGISKEHYEKIFIAKVTSLEKHPDAENLKILTVTGNHSHYKAISNSKNLEKGDFIVFSTAGTILPCGIEVKEVEIRKEKSEGMILAKEHLNLEEKSQDIWILGRNEKTAKSLFEKYTEEDFLFNIELTANRSDCLSVIGIAREVAAMLDKELSIPKPVIPETIDEIPDVQILEKNLCPRYSARILRNIDVKESPDWLKRKLELCGIRPINNIVDATNFVLLEYGHPMHAFDLNRLEGKKIIVRSSGSDESFKTLDGQSHSLKSEMLVISDEKRAVALAGIMGGENSEILDSTTDILLESAYFDPISIRSTSKITGLKTESSYRFERTADWGITTSALEKATEIILMTCTPQISKIRDEYVNIFKDKIINVKADIISSKIGIDFSTKEIESILKRLKFSIVAKREDALEVKVPTFRSDVSKMVDIVEEIARIYGYNNIPQNDFKPAVDVESLKPKKEIKDSLRRIFTEQGYTEAFNFSFTNEDELKKFMAMDDYIIRLQNPLSQDASVLRNHLYYGLLGTVEYNVKNAYRDNVRFFEIGNVFTKSKPLPGQAREAGSAHIKENKKYKEIQKIGFILYGKGYNFYSASGMMEYVLKKIGGRDVDFQKCVLPFLHPVNSANIVINRKIIGFIGEVIPDITDRLDLKYPAYIAEFETEYQSGILNTPLEIKLVSKFPPTKRDISIVVDKSVFGREIMFEIEKSNGWIKDVEFVDLFMGNQIAGNKKSLTFSITFQCIDRTLTDQEVNEVMDRLIEKLKTKFKAELRM